MAKREENEKRNRITNYCSTRTDLRTNAIKKKPDKAQAEIKC